MRVRVCVVAAPHDLFGVVCVDVNVDRLSVADNSASVRQSMESTSLTCPQLSLSESMLEALRLREAGVQSMCSYSSASTLRLSLAALAVVLAAVLGLLW